MTRLAVVLVLLLAGDAHAVTKDEADAMQWDHGTATLFKEVTCTGASKPVLSKAETRTAIRMMLRNIDQANRATLCPGTTCAAENQGWSLEPSDPLKAYMIRFIVDSIRDQDFSCFSTAGAPIVEVWVEKIVP